MINLSITDGSTSFSLEVPSDDLTVRELIVSVVRREIEHYGYRYQGRCSYALIPSTYTEAMQNGQVDQAYPTADTETTCANALSAFEHQRCLLFVDDRQLTELDQIVQVYARSQVRFVEEKAFLNSKRETIAKVQTFIDECLNHNQPTLSAGMRARFIEISAKLAEDPLRTDIFFNDQEANEIFELHRIARREWRESIVDYRSGYIDKSKSYLYDSTKFLKFSFYAENKKNEQLFLESAMLSDKVKEDFLALEDALGRSYYGIREDSEKLEKIKNFVKNLSKEDFEKMAVLLTRSIAKSQNKNYFYFLSALYDSSFFKSEMLLKKILPYTQALYDVEFDCMKLNLKMLSTLKKIHKSKNLDDETKALLRKHFLYQPCHRYMDQKKGAEINQTVEWLLIDQDRGEESIAIWPLNNIGQTYWFDHSNQIAWPDEIYAQIQKMEPAKSNAWLAIWQHAAAAKTSQPSQKWLKTAQQLIMPVTAEFGQQLIDWVRFMLKHSPTSGQPFSPQNEPVIRGLIWFFVYSQHIEKPVVLSEVIRFGYEKLFNQGPRTSIVANAALYVLGEMGIAGVTQLSSLRHKIKYQKAQDQIEKILYATATKLGMSTADLEDFAVPEAKGLVGGKIVYQIGDYEATIHAKSAQCVEVIWSNQDKVLAAPPQAAKNIEYKEIVKQIKQEHQSLSDTLGTQSKRLEDSILQRRTWTYEGWQNQLVNHQILGWLAQRLIWQFETDGQLQHGFYTDGQWCDVAGQPLQHLTEQTLVRVWHPIFSTAEEVLAWRQLLINRQIVQPFKQAFREVYLVTPAELEAENQSMRYASHYLKQHQLKALCDVRGWSYKLQGSWHEYPPTCHLKAWDDLSVSFNVTNNGDEPQSASGVFLYVKTEEVQFSQNTPVEQDGEVKYRHERLALAEVPPLVFSEVMRDIDLFVGVCSIGTDATLGQAETDHQGMREYWQNSRFADLTASALVRKDTLDMIISKLAIAPQCRFEGKYLQVEGKLRSYKIHLGSGNILMSPNDQYLCIVSDHKKALHALDQMYLPFEGDQMLSLILSKALLLAADDQIKDRSIVQQIQRV